MAIQCRDYEIIGPEPTQRRIIEIRPAPGGGYNIIKDGKVGYYGMAFKNMSVCLGHIREWERGGKIVATETKRFWQRSTEDDKPKPCKEFYSGLI